MNRIALLLLAVNCASAQMRLVSQPAKSPLVTFRFVFLTGSSADPASKPGLSYLTAMMLANGGAKDIGYPEILQAMFPMAASVTAQVDTEMCAFTGATHVENLDAYYKLLRAMLLTPGFREEDFRRVKADAINSIRTGLRANDEELGKQALYQNIFEGTPYGHHPMGTVSSLESITLEDVQQFYAHHYSQSNLILGIAGGYTPEFLAKVQKDFRALPAGGGFRPRRKPPALIEANRAVIVAKDTRPVAYSIGFPISVTHDSLNYAALLVAISYFGQHRMSGGLLFNEMREKRGLNYGDYAYIDYFPRATSQMEPSPNVARHFEIFEMWIRPVETANAKFALRLAMYELNKLIKEGVPPDAFEATRDFLRKYLYILTRTQSAQLGYAIDGLFYDIPNYTEHLRTQLAKLKREDVNAAIQRYLRAERLVIVAVGKDGDGLKQELASDDPSPVTYNSPKQSSVTDEDKVVSKWPLKLPPGNITVIPVDQVFQ